jgi:hypothetical protein
MAKTPKPAAPFACCVSARLFARAYSIAVQSPEWRPAISGVSVEPLGEDKGVLLVGTDGRRLVALHDKGGKANGKGIVHPSKAIAAALTGTVRPAIAVGKKTVVGEAVYLIVRGDKAVVAWFASDDIFQRVAAPDDTVAAFQWARATIDMTFPDWRGALKAPTDTKAPLGTFNPLLLAPVARALSDAAPRRGEEAALSVRLVPTDPGGPIFVHLQGASGFGVIMPTRSWDEPFSLPSWAAP